MEMDQAGTELKWNNIRFMKGKVGLNKNKSGWNKWTRIKLGLS